MTWLVFWIILLLSLDLYAIRYDVQYDGGQVVVKYVTDRAVVHDLVLRLVEYYYSVLDISQFYVAAGDTSLSVWAWKTFSI